MEVLFLFASLLILWFLASFHIACILETIICEITS
jgi:hypothetical protein